MDVAALTRELVSIPSHKDETAAGDFVERWLQERTPATVERDAHGNVFARRGAGDRTLALTGHHDVVPPDNSQIDAEGGYEVAERDGRLHGRGTADMKGCLAAAMCAMRDVDSDALDCELVVASFVAEEDGAEGSKAAVEDGFAPDLAIVGEGSTGYSASGVTDVAVAHKGRRGSTIMASGTAAHASEPDAGENAIYRAQEAIQLVRELAVPTTEIADTTVTGSLVVTEIEGGNAWNVVPEQCSFTIDERTVPGERASFDTVAERDGVSCTVDQDLPPMACGDDAFADLVRAVATDAQPGTPEHVVKPHATDAGRLAQAGTDCVVVGAAEPGEAHTASESVDLDVLDRCYRIYRDVAQRVGGTGS
jgi:acetylornithine deacetylase